MNLARSALNALRRHTARMRVRRRDFTVVSNNCWGAHIYQVLGEKYRTPFVGLFFAPECYLRLVERFRWYAEQPLRFLAKSRHEYVNALREERGLRYPIGCLGEAVEIHFQHYGSEAEAIAKWNRRIERMTRDDSRLFFKFCDRDGCSQAQLAAFDSAPLAHKVCFVSRPSPKLRSAIWIPGSEDGQVPYGLKLSGFSFKYFDAAGWLNGGDARPRWWLPTCM